MIEFAFQPSSVGSSILAFLLCVYLFSPIGVLILHLVSLFRKVKVPNYAITLAVGSSLHLTLPPSWMHFQLLFGLAIPAFLCPLLAFVTLRYKREPIEESESRVLSTLALLSPFLIALLLRFAFPGPFPAPS